MSDVHPSAIVYPGTVLGDGVQVLEGAVVGKQPTLSPRSTAKREPLAPAELGDGTIVSTDDHLAKSIYPDIVVHQREIPNNLLAVEVRKSANHQPLEHDQHKLRALTDPHLWFAYWIGVLLTLDKKQVTVTEVYTSGVLDHGLSAWFAGRLKDAGLSAG